MKKLITNYNFDPVNRLVTLNDYIVVNPSGLLLVTDVTTGTIIYNFADPALNGTFNGNIVTLEYDTSAIAASDKLQIWYDDGIDANTAIISLLTEMNEHLKDITEILYNTNELQEEEVS